MANVNTKQVYSQVEKMGPDLKSAQKLQDKLSGEKGLFTENTSPKAEHPTSVPSEIPNTQEGLNRVENESTNITDFEKTSVETENTTHKSNITNFFNSALNFILKPISPIRTKAIELNLTFAYSTKKIIALSISLLTVTAICIIGIALVSELFIPAMLAVWLVSYVFWPVTPAPEEIELTLSGSTQESSAEEDTTVINKVNDKTLSTIIESDEEDIEDNSDELRVLHNLVVPEMEIQDTAKELIKDFEKKTEKKAAKVEQDITEQYKKLDTRINKRNGLPPVEEESIMPPVQPESTESDDSDKRKLKKEDKITKKKVLKKIETEVKKVITEGEAKSKKVKEKIKLELDKQEQELIERIKTRKPKPKAEAEKPKENMAKDIEETNDDFLNLIETDVFDGPEIKTKKVVVPKTEKKDISFQTDDTDTDTDTDSEFEVTLEKEEHNTSKETHEEEFPENPEDFENRTFPEKKEEHINKAELEPVVNPQPEVVDYQRLQQTVEEVDDIKALNSVLAQYINQAIKEIAIKKIKAIFQQKGVKVDTLKSKKMALRDVKSHTDAYQYLMYRLEKIEKSSTDKSKILEYGDLGQIATNFTFNGKSENYELGLVVIAREAAANVLYVFDKTNLLDKIKERFDNPKTKSAYTKALKSFRIGITRRSLPIRSKALTTSFTDLYGITHTIKMSTASDAKTKESVIARINNMLGVVEKSIIKLEEEKPAKKNKIRNSSKTITEKKKPAVKVQKKPLLQGTGSLKRVKGQ